MANKDTLKTIGDVLERQQNRTKKQETHPALDGMFLSDGAGQVVAPEEGGVEPPGFDGVTGEHLHFPSR